MQAFDALTLKATIHELLPSLINFKVDKVWHISRDEIILSLVNRLKTNCLLLSAHAAFGRACLTKAPQTNAKNKSGFALFLKQHILGAKLIGIEQIPGERIIDLIFACPDEFGVLSHKVLTAEIMGRHSNLIFWDKESQLILASSHPVTSEMSRKREILAGFKYVRPPQAEKPNIFQIKKESFLELFANHKQNTNISLDKWLLDTFSGLGRPLSEEIAVSLKDKTNELSSALWQRIEFMQKDFIPKPAMRLDLTAYTVVSWYPDIDDQNIWKKFISANDLVENYFFEFTSRQQFHDLRDSTTNRLKQEITKLQKRINDANKSIDSASMLDNYKKFGDLILANIVFISPGQTALSCSDLYATDDSKVTIPLDCNLSPSQNAKYYYRLYTKGNLRLEKARLSLKEASNKFNDLKSQLQKIEESSNLKELEAIKDNLLPAEHVKESKVHRSNKKSQKRLLSIISSDGWTIYAGRNRQENDDLISHFAEPNDLWMHILGQSGGHVLIKVPSTNKEPPARTLQEAALIAAYFTKSTYGSIVRVVYTKCKYVRKITKSQPGVVRYENEKTLEVDTKKIASTSFKQLLGKAKD